MSTHPFPGGLGAAVCAWPSRTSTPDWRPPLFAVSKGPATNAAGSTSPEIRWPTFPRAKRWCPQRSGRSSPRKAPKRSPPMGSRRQHAPRALRQGRTLMVRAKEGPLASDLVHQSARASQQRNQTPRQRRRDLSQRRGRHPTLRCRRPRHQRRVGISGTALLLRSFYDRSLPADAMKARRPESSCVPRDRHRG